MACRPAQLLLAEAAVYDYEPTDSMEPPAYFAELSQEMELLVYGSVGFYDATLERISEAYEGDDARRRAAMLMQSFARRNRAIGARHARLLEQLHQERTTEAVLAAGKIQARFRTRKPPASAASSPSRKQGGTSQQADLDQSKLARRLMSEEEAQVADGQRSADRHGREVRRRQESVAEVELGAKHDKQHERMGEAMQLAANAIERAALRFLNRRQETVAAETHCEPSAHPPTPTFTHTHTLTPYTPHTSHLTHLTPHTSLLTPHSSPTPRRRRNSSTRSCAAYSPHCRPTPRTPPERSSRTSVA